MAAQRRFIPNFIISITVLSVLACQSAYQLFSTPTPISNASADLPSSEMIYDGNWQGKTSQDIEITFTVTHGGISAMKFGAEWQDQNCRKSLETKMETTTNPTAEATGNFTFIHPIQSGAFTITQDNSSIDGTVYTFMGTFSSPETASGTIEYVVTTGSCQGTKRFEWTAKKFLSRFERKETNEKVRYLAQSQPTKRTSDGWALRVCVFWTFVWLGAFLFLQCIHCLPT